MDEQENQAPSTSPTPETALSFFSAHGRINSKNTFQRRVTALFAASFAAFSFTTWLLTRTQIGGGESRDAGTAEGVVRMQLNALAQGELQIAYGQFSPQYREEVPFATFQQIVSTHGEMFRANTIAIEQIENSASRDEMRVRISSADGQHYVARYATVLIDGRWWIDAMRWRPDESPPERVFTRAMPAGTREIAARSCNATRRAARDAFDSARRAA